MQLMVVTRLCFNDMLCWHASYMVSSFSGSVFCWYFTCLHSWYCTQFQAIVACIICRIYLNVFPFIFMCRNGFSTTFKQYYFIIKLRHALSSWKSVHSCVLCINPTWVGIRVMCYWFLQTQLMSHFSNFSAVSICSTPFLAIWTTKSYLTLFLFCVVWVSLLGTSHYYFS